MFIMYMCLHTYAYVCIGRERETRDRERSFQKIFYLQEKAKICFRGRETVSSWAVILNIVLITQISFLAYTKSTNASPWRNKFPFK